MPLLTPAQQKEAEKWMLAAAEVAKGALCLRAKC